MEINYKQIIFAREYRGYSQTELASKIVGLSQSNLSKYEKGIGPLSTDVLNRIIDFLGFPTDFYEKKISNIAENAHYRRKKGMTKNERSQIDLSNKLLGYIVEQMGESVEFPDMSFRMIDLEDGYTPETVAQYTSNGQSKLRLVWKFKSSSLLSCFCFCRVKHGYRVCYEEHSGFFAFVMTDTAVLPCSNTSCKLRDLRLRIHIYPQCVISLITACCKGMGYLLAHSSSP